MTRIRVLSPVGVATRDIVTVPPLPESLVGVTVFGGEPPHNVNDHVSPTAAGILATVADTAVSLGSNVG